jgi:hypothetical protein
MADNPYDKVLEGLKQSAEGLIKVNEGLMSANEGLKRAIPSALTAKDEHEDLRETVHRLESLVMALTDEVKKLRGGN